MVKNRTEPTVRPVNIIEPGPGYDLTLSLSGDDNSWKGLEINISQFKWPLIGGSSSLLAMTTMFQDVGIYLDCNK
jgi:hypothetical protein